MATWHAGNPPTHQQSSGGDLPPDEQIGGRPAEARPGIRTDRARVEQATGILMAAHTCDAATAFGMLVAASRRTNVGMRELARRFVAENHRGGTDRHDVRAVVDAALARAARR